MAEKLRVFTFPCNENDIKAMESWLEDMAAEGYLIDQLLPAGIIHFSEQEPIQVRYCLLFTPDYKKKREITAHEQKVIDEQMRAGWEYAAKYGKYLIFMTDDDEVAEPVQDFDEILRVAKQEQKMWYINDLLLLVVLMIAVLPKIRWFSLVDFVVPFGILMSIVLRAINANELKKLQLKIVSGTYVTQKTDWKTNAGKYRVMNMFGIGSVILMWAGVIALFYVRIIL